MGTLRLRINFCWHFKILEGTTEQFCKLGLLYKHRFYRCCCSGLIFRCPFSSHPICIKMKKNLQSSKYEGGGRVQKEKKQTLTYKKRRSPYLQNLSRGFKVVVCVTCPERDARPATPSASTCISLQGYNMQLISRLSFPNKVVL